LLVVKPTGREDPVDGDLCPICWQPHNWRDEHEVVSAAAFGDELALIEALVGLGVVWDTRLDPDDPTERPYGLLRMLDDAADIGLECGEVGGRWVVTSARGLSSGAAA
jgi:hypothetical protein